MKWMIASDLHGSAYYCEKLLAAFNAEQADRMLLLGDLLYHGPRNDLPRDYDPRAVTALLNGCKERLLCVRGNCDAEVDQMVLEFPILAEYALLEVEGRVLFATHGHKYGPDNLPPLCPGDILLSGHTHVPVCREAEGILLWALAGLKRLVANHFRFTESPRAIANREVLRQDANNVILFMESTG